MSVLTIQGTGVIDTSLYKEDPNNPLGGNTIHVGEDNTFVQLFRGLVKFDLSDIPPNSTISSAVMTLWLREAGNWRSSNNRVLSVYRVLRAWTESATWNKYDGSNNWGTAGCSNTSTDREATAIGTHTMNVADADESSHDFTLTTSKIQEIIDEEFTNNGFLLQVATENADRFAFYSTDEGTATTKRPKLVITYTTAWEKELTEAITLVANALKGAAKIFAQAISLSPTFKKAPTKNLPEAIDLVDSAPKAVTKAPFTETVTLVDVLDKYRIKILTEALQIADSFEKAAGKLLTETATLTDTLTKDTTRLFSEAISLAVSFTKAPSKIFSEALSLVDSIIKTPGRIFTESLSLSDSFTKTPTKILSETMTLVDKAVEFFFNTLATKIPKFISTLAKPKPEGGIMEVEKPTGATRDLDKPTAV